MSTLWSSLPITVRVHVSGVSKYASAHTKVREQKTSDTDSLIILN